MGTRLSSGGTGIMKKSKEVIVSSNDTAKHRMIRRELRNARNVLNNHQEFSSSLCALAARVVVSYGRAYNGGA